MPEPLNRRTLIRNGLLGGAVLLGGAAMRWRPPPPPPPAAPKRKRKPVGWAYVSGSTTTAVSGASVTSMTIQPAQNVTAGNTLIVGAAFVAPSITGMAYASGSDNQGGTYLYSVAADSNLYGHLCVTQYVSPITVAGGTRPVITIPITGGTATQIALIVAEFSGIYTNLASPGLGLTYNAGASSNFGLSTSTPASQATPSSGAGFSFPITYASANELAIGLCATSGGSSATFVETAAGGYPAANNIGYTGASSTLELCLSYVDTGNVFGEFFEFNWTTSSTEPAYIAQAIAWWNDPNVPPVTQGGGWW